MDRLAGIHRLLQLAGRAILDRRILFYFGLDSFLAPGLSKGFHLQKVCSGHGCMPVATAVMGGLIRKPRG